MRGDNLFMKRRRALPDLAKVTSKLSKVQTALAQNLPRNQCLRKWSEFIRERDGHRCVDCHSTRSIAAHHICRKSLLEEAQFQTGNGITLCSRCHKAVHHGFNGRPDLSLPVDAQGGEKLATMERLYSILTDDAVERGLLVEAFYFLSDSVLSTFKRMQGYGPQTYFPGSRIEQAFLILAEGEFATRRALLRENGIPPPDRPLLPGGLYLVTSATPEHPQQHIVIQTYKARSDF